MTKPISILLVEDMEADAGLVCAALRAKGYGTDVRVVASERDYRAALDKLPDLVLSDYNLPGFSGLRALELLRARNQETPFILLSGVAGEEIAVLAMQLGATDYLSKDHLTRLVPAIERAMELQRVQAEKTRATKELLQSQRDLEIAQARANIGSWELDLKTGQLRWSKQMYSLMGRDASLRPPKLEEFLTYIHPEERQRTLAEYVSMGGEKLDHYLAYMDAGNRARLLAEFSPAARSNGQRRLEFRSNPERGPVRHLSATIDVTRDEQGRPSLGGGTLLDVTERKLAEAALLQNQADLEAAQERARIGSWELDLKSGRGRWSKQMYRLLGRESSLSPPKIDEFLSYVHPEDRQRVLAEYAPAEFAREQRRIEFRTNPERGEVRHLSVTIDVLRDAQDRPSVAGGTVLDITERKAAEITLRESEERFRLLVEGVKDYAIIMLDPNGCVLAWNEGARRLKGYDAAEMIGASMERFYAPEDLAAGRPARLLASATAEGRAEDEGWRVRKDGSRFYADVVLTAMRDQVGSLRGFAKFTRDITQRKQADDRLLRLNRTLAMLSSINGLIVRVASRDDLFRGACDIIFAQGGLDFAWIGMFDDSVGVRPIASAGPHQDYLKDLPLVAKSVVTSPRLIDIVRRERNHVVINDIETDCGFQSSALAMREGFRSLILLPLLGGGGEPFGVLSLYSTQKDAFDAEEIKLLQELAGDVSFAIDHLEKAERLDYLAYYDALTGLPNRSLFQKQVTQMVNVARRQKTPMAVLLLDPERFRLINVSLGRDGGDEFLRQAAARLQSLTRGGDLVARIGPDLFAVAISGLGKAADAANYLNHRLLPEFEHPFEIRGQELRVSARAGIALYPDDGVDAETLIAGAEGALRTAKKDLARLAFHTPEVNARVSQALMLETRLRSALLKQEFVLHYQPKVELETGAIVGLEALIRWNDPESGLVPPVTFISLLEETGLIVDVGKWALHQAVSDSLAWAAKGTPLPRIAVNVSPVQLRQKEFVGTVLEAIGRFGQTGHLLDLEITESTIMEQIDTMADKLQQLRITGVGISLDDFGTGYSSLAYLGRLPIDTLKIDRAFIMNMETDEYSHNVVSMTCALARAAKLKVVAEGVETQGQVTALRALGCDQMQGYLFSKPLPLDELALLLQRSPVHAGRRGIMLA